MRWGGDLMRGRMDRSINGRLVSATIKFAIATGRLEDRSNKGNEEPEEEVSSADEEEAV